MSIKGYKVFNNDWTCRGFQYKVGGTYKLDGDLEICKRGFHFCKKANNCFNYYSFDSRNRVAEVEAIGAVVTDGDKCATDEIKIVREITWNELLSIVNTGTGNTGLNNTGNNNSGNYNTGGRDSGNYNTGDFNTGNCNTGDCNRGSGNTGHFNTGNGNIGNCNDGNYNSGHWNTGSWNSGDWNKSDFSTGFFSTETQPIYMFNKPTQYTDNRYIRLLEGMKILDRNFENACWIYSHNMTHKEKVEHPEHKTTGGYLKVIDFKTACKTMWDKLSEDEKEEVKKLPNFDHDIFMEITGIDSNK